MLSVVVPAYNASLTVGRAVASAFSAGARQVVVIDDGSTDDTGSVARSNGASVLRQSNSGANAARARGFAEVSADFVIFLDADDELIKEGVAEALEALGADSNLAAVVGGFAIRDRVSGRRQVHLPWPEGIGTESLLARGHAPAPPASIVWRVVGFDPASLGVGSERGAAFAEDYAWLIRASMISKIGAVRRPISTYEASGGKSVRAPFKELSEAERVRRHFAAVVGVQIAERSRADVRGLALRRRAMGERARSRRVALTLLSVAASPFLYVSLWRERARRRKPS
ncbi:GalNAc(5)-diNAcBac-PP-undecaprenol beta-1,3-glucosyltransferase [mine drainage metagenome]|uniref:GalNAc(5)-diNAcBac-PP-undecaprenol beta-1,3-glucosyltransferase n=1 Tax=mine drainage metagenome TaxID=410659 RepID=A0A1J5QVY3_9ZZZZ